MEQARACDVSKHSSSQDSAEAAIFDGTEKKGSSPANSYRPISCFDPHTFTRSHTHTHTL